MPIKLVLLAGRHVHVDLEGAFHEVEIADVCERALGPDGFVLITLEVGL